MSCLSALPSEILQVVERAAEHAHGFDLLESGGVEAVAVLFGVHPASVEAARSLAQDPKRRNVLVEALARARSPAASPAPADAGEPRTEPAAPKDARQLIREIDTYPGGRDLLLEAPAETIAVLFAAHPFVVGEARDLACTLPSASA